MALAFAPTVLSLRFAFLESCAHEDAMPGSSAPIIPADRARLIAVRVPQRPVPLLVRGSVSLRETLDAVRSALGVDEYEAFHLVTVLDGVEYVPQPLVWPLIVDEGDRLRIFTLIRGEGVIKPAVDQSSPAPQGVYHVFVTDLSGRTVRYGTFRRCCWVFLISGRRLCDCPRVYAQAAHRREPWHAVRSTHILGSS